MKRKKLVFHSRKLYENIFKNFMLIPEFYNSNNNKSAFFCVLLDREKKEKHKKRRQEWKNKVILTFNSRKTWRMKLLVQRKITI